MSDWSEEDSATYADIAAIELPGTRPRALPLALERVVSSALVVLLRSIGLISSGDRVFALENLAFRQQLAALTRTLR